MRRRAFLAGMGTAVGAALFSPILRRARADSPIARRFVFIVEGNGILPTQLMTPSMRALIEAQATNDTEDRLWFPERYGHSEVLVDSAPLSSAPVLDPLASTGGGLDLSDRAAVVLGLSSTITGGGHSTYFGALSSTRSTPSRAGGPTIDALLASLPEVRSTAPYDAVRLGVHALEESMNTTTCAYAAAQAAPVIIDPTRAFVNLFGVVGDADSQAAFARKGDLLDYALTDVQASLSAFPGNSRERAKLEAYLASLEAVQARQLQMLALSDTLAAVAPDNPSSSALYASEDPLRRLQAHVDMVQAALIGGLTNVAVLALGTGGGFNLPYPSLIDDFSRHDLYHMPLSTDGTALPVLQAATRDLVSKAAGLARALAAVPEGDGTMLDHTLIVLMSDNGETHHSSAHEWPLLLLGGQALGVATDGRSLAYPGVNNSENRQLSNFFNTLGYAAGTELDHFGTEGSTRIASGPLSQLWR